MRGYDEYKQILELWELGINKKAISLYTGIPRTTIFECIQRYGTVAVLNEQREQTAEPVLLKILKGNVEGDHRAILEAYAYLLGLYLGDGNIVHMRRVFRLRISLDTRYPNIIDSCMQAEKTLFPDHQIGIVERLHDGRPSCVDVSIYHKNLPLFFPQHGVGRKHNRQIQLETWQQQIVDAYPIEFLRGLYHSDGSRFSNIVNGKDYPRYQFTNTSTDILKLYSDTCDRLSLHWTIKSRASKNNVVGDVYISKRKDVAFLDSVIGPKT